jgi:hypothetical protein
MPKGSPGKPRPNARKPHKASSYKLALKADAFARASTTNATASIEVSLAMMKFVAGEAFRGNTTAIGLLAKMSLEASGTVEAPIVVYRPDGEVAAWIC